MKTNGYLTVIIFGFWIYFTINQANAQEPITKGLNSITSASLIKTTKFLASDKLKGRMQSSAEYEIAAKYVLSRFTDFGLKASYQIFNDEYNEIKYARLALLNDAGYEVKIYKLGEDFVCRGFTGSGNVKSEVVFCGYGIENEYYNDYRSINVKGKVVMVFKTSPGWKIENGSWGDISPRAKARTAKKHGALAIIFINQPNELPQRILAGSVACGEKPHLPDFPMIQISNNIVDTLLIKLNQAVKELYERINSVKAPYSVELGTRVSIKVQSEYQEEKQTSNVIGILEGKSKRLKDEYIIIGAHLDHVNNQTERLIFPGANDNASGVASIIEIAKAIKLSGVELKRSIVFVAFSSEESGLRGSKYFVENSPIPMEKIKLMINFDCVGQGDSIAVGGKMSFPKLWQITSDLDKKHTKLLSKKTFGGGGADAEAFYKAGKPTLYFNTSGGYTYLHLPSDKVETLNLVLFEKLTKLGFLTVVELANGDYDGENDISKK